jgi:hypothetical protein
VSTNFYSKALADLNLGTSSIRNGTDAALFLFLSTALAAPSTPLSYRSLLSTFDTLTGGEANALFREVRAPLARLAEKEARGEV